eukprot:1133781-Amphidinium_carterae.2
MDLTMITTSKAADEVCSWLSKSWGYLPPSLALLRAQGTLLCCQERCRFEFGEVALCAFRGH